MSSLLVDTSVDNKYYIAMTMKMMMRMLVLIVVEVFWVVP